MKQAKPMEPTGPHETAAEIDAVAAGWVARQDRAALSQAEQDELEQWAAADPRRAGAYARALAIHLHLDRVAALGDDFAADAPDAPALSTRRRAMAVAAGAVIACGTGLGLLAVNRSPKGVAPVAIGTARGAVREAGLAEGSRITLNTMTQVVPTLTDTMRAIDLLEGEALFDVTKDPNRPFIVRAGDFAVRAVGTSFSVRRTGPGAIKVVVSEGVVEVSRGTDVLGLVHAGIAFVVDSATPVIETLSHAQINSALAWRAGRLDLEGLTLAQAAAEFSRYSDVTITLQDPSTANLHIAGVYATNDPAGFAENVALSLGLKSSRKGKEVILSRP
jgi:transmembrane sensor